MTGGERSSQTAPGVDILPAKMDLTDRSQGAMRWAMLLWALVTVRATAIARDNPTKSEDSFGDRRRQNIAASLYFSFSLFLLL